MTGTCLVVSEVDTSGLKTIDFQQYGKVPVEYSTSDLRNNPRPSGYWSFIYFNLSNKIGGD